MQGCLEAVASIQLAKRGLSLEESGPLPTPRFLGSDEFARRKGHCYDTILCDLDARTVLEVSAGRKKDEVVGVLERLSDCDGVEAVSIEGLSKAYGQIKAVQSLNLGIRKGEIFALLGPNGAGKTTTIEILEGYRTRDSGSVRVLGLDPQNRAELARLKERMGVMLQQSSIYQIIRVGEALKLFASYYDKPMDVGELLRLVGRMSCTTRKPER